MFWKNDGEIKKGKTLVIWFWAFIGMLTALISSIVIAHEKKTKRGNVPAIIFIPLLVIVIFIVITIWSLFFDNKP